MNQVCAPKWEEMNRRLVSLWDLMERFRLEKFIKAYQNASAIHQTWLTARDYQPTLNSVQLSHADYRDLIESLATLHTLVEEQGMTLTAMSVASAREAADMALKLDQFAVFEIGPMVRLSAAIKDMQSRVRDEFIARYVLVVPSNRVSFYDPNKPLFGDKVDKGFEAVSFDISEAGKCLGVGRYTASVFHLMRVLETGIRAIARCLGVPDPVKDADRNWGKMLKSINDAIKTRKAAMSAYDADLFDEAYIALDKVRSLWRNPTMHVGNKYTEEEAKEIWDAVSVFMRKLASRMDENGMPQV